MFEGVDEGRHGGERDELRGVLVETLPHLVVHVEVVLREALLDVVGGLREVLEDDSDVHVDDHQVTHHQVAHQEQHGHTDAATISVGSVFIPLPHPLHHRYLSHPPSTLRVKRGIFKASLAGVHRHKLGFVHSTSDVRLGITEGWFDHQASQNSIPTSRGGNLEEEGHGAEEGFKVEKFFNASVVFDVHEEGHAEDGVDEHDEEEEEANVDQGRQRHCQGEQESSNTLG